ncbi:hypothetical protein [Nitrospira sp. Nam74]
MYLHWSKKLAWGLLVGCGIPMIVLVISGLSDIGILTPYLIGWMALNYVGLIVWIVIWMGDQARMRGKATWAWLLPVIAAPVPTLMMFILYLLRPMKS